MSWFLVFPLVMSVGVHVPRVDVNVKMPDYKTCVLIRDLNTPGPNGTPGPQCWELERK